MEQVINVTDLQRRAGEYVNQAAAGREPIVVESNGQPKEALISLDEYPELRRAHARAASSANLLWRIAGVGASGRSDVSERVDEILTAEIDAQRGWSAAHGGAVQYRLSVRRGGQQRPESRART